MSNLGSFVWYDLMTTDAASAQAFYRAVVGNWTMTPFGDTGYEMFTVGDTPVGGVNQLPEGSDTPTHWLAYAVVDDVDAGKAKVEQMGGTILSDEDMPGVGRFAVFQDPWGAVMAMFDPADEASANPDAPGYPSWHELYTGDLEAAWSFYTALFGWQMSSEMEMGPQGTYRMYREGFRDEGASLGGIMKRPPQMPVNTWLYYINVRSLDESVQAVAEHGGHIVIPPMEVPGGDRISIAVDPQGGHFAIYESQSG